MQTLNLRSTPNMEPPPGVTAHPVDASPIPVDIIVTASICLFLAASAICARTFTKAYYLKHMQVEDCRTQIGFVAFIGLLFKAASAGQGSHIWDVSPSSIKRVVQLSNVIAIVYAPVMLAAKLAVLLQIGRIFAGIKKNFMYWAVRILIVLNAFSYTGIFLVRTFTCVPRAKISDPSIPGNCISQTGSIIGIGMINATSDIAILILPLYGVSKLQLPSKRKIGVAAMFCVGLIACVASAFCLYYSVRLDTNPDFTKAVWQVNMWT
ncbi:hypothetical protein K469DRAFT_650609 [Zopfia rhizophila CBS 207.26]|uniref:Rhodopsin domain-containing protein n=1 Tax=Zopfia rhizophila CBS 207.26 TaxID=1314779 RepID=A0A6A6EV78_9PEZI|nr:hypothetical protein K469DRAFT_650609 [Zopfia rhizophila CBS 207.26]